MSKDTVVMEIILSFFCTPGFSRILYNKLTIFLWVTVTPFGFPVDPEVYNI